ncbi:MAG: P-loop NTPase [Thermoanaerobaculia bacterium]
MKTYAELAGQSDSQIVEQVVARQERQKAALAEVRHLVAVASGKGGVGKSTVTIGLAAALLGSGRKVAVLDGDLNGPSQARLAGMGERPWVPGPDGSLALPRRADGLGVVSMGSVLEAGGALTFEAFARGDEQVWRASREITLVQDLLCSVEWGELDALFVDLPPGAALTSQFAGLLGPRTRFVLVTLPVGLSREVVARSVAALAAAGATALGYVDNMSGYRCPGCREVQPLFPPSGDALPLPRLGALAFDPELASLCEAGWPAGSDAAPRAREELARLAETLWNRLEETAP